MKISSLISADENCTIEIIRRADGLFELNRYDKHYDVEEDAESIVRSLPNPPGLYSDAQLAEQAARHILGL